MDIFRLTQMLAQSNNFMIVFARWKGPSTDPLLSGFLDSFYSQTFDGKTISDSTKCYH